MMSTSVRPLPLTNAERQARWRAKKIATEGDEFLKRETVRVKAYYKPVATLSAKDKKIFRQRTNERVRRHRDKAKRLRLAEQRRLVEENADQSDDDDDEEFELSSDGSDYGDDDDDDGNTEVRGMNYSFKSLIS